jgi:hypothetical protein
VFCNRHHDCRVDDLAGPNTRCDLWPYLAIDKRARRSGALRLRSLAYRSPMKAASAATKLLSKIRSSGEPCSGEREELIGIFSHLANLGFYSAAERLAREAENFLSETAREGSTGALKMRFELRHAFGLLEINFRLRPRQAALHFALAQRAADRLYGTEPTWDFQVLIWRARHARLLSWIVAGNASRALRVGRWRNVMGRRPELNGISEERAAGAEGAQGTGGPARGVTCARRAGRSNRPRAVGRCSEQAPDPSARSTWPRSPPPAGAATPVVSA